jgi:hypothetical protein
MPSVYLKQGVYGNLVAPCRRAFGGIARHYFAKNLNYLVTSIGEGAHSPGSFHYDEKAWDFKRQGVKINTIRMLIGSDFDVVEYEDIDIFHIELDPK